MKILALDQARLCGYAFGKPGEKPVSQVLDMGRSGTPSPEYLWRWGQRLRELIERYDPDLVAYERPFFSAKTATSGERLLKMAGVVEVVCYAKRIDMEQVANGSWKSKFCGTNKFNKGTVPYPPILECEQRGIEINGSNDRADAVGIWFYAALKHEPKAMSNMDTPLFAHSK